MTDPNPAPAPQGNPNPAPDPALNPAPSPDPKASLNPNPNPNPNPSPDPAPPKAEWGETWREDYATKVATGADGKLDEALRDKVVNRLKRFNSVKDTLDWTFNADKKLSDGSYKKPLGDKATPEEIAEYRKQNGIPEKAEAYFEKLPDGLVIGEEDKPIFDDVAKALHGVHADPRVAQTIAKWYYDWQDRNEAAQHQANIDAKAATEDAMRQEWGPDYRPNINMVNQLIGAMPQELQDLFYKSVTPDGKQIMNSPATMKWLAQQARELNYTGATLPTGESAVKSLDVEIADIEKQMGDKKSAYWKGPMHASGDTQMQVRYRELIDMRTKVKGRAA